MILNALRAIVAGWEFQLNGDVAVKLCRKNIDLVEFGVNSIPKLNNVLCLRVIPKGTESEIDNEITWMTFTQLQFSFAPTRIVVNPAEKFVARSWKFSRRTT